MAKDPQNIDKRIPIVMALLIALFCYYTWSPNSPFITVDEQQLEDALNKQQPAYIKGIVLISAVHPLSPSRFLLDTKTADQQELQVIVSMPQAPLINSHWLVRGSLRWNNQAIVDTTLDKASFTAADAKDFQ
ncbi:hypothetical protein ACVFI8_15060 [Agarivorans sp. MS3-6]|uniref:hypothetical protein n=1 Tax=Agarivorans sp. TSD2052 TaxID=2937286 RepID=UPI00200FA9DD|nr:hypothetical protein [Agarivorans sp. TSD2052]UPW17806.1 hypothetical protein M0C34_16440 [Agarivorans sp. TSD2052]